MAYKFSMYPTAPHEIGNDICAEFTAQEISLFHEEGKVTIDINGHTQIWNAGRQVTFTARADLSPSEALDVAKSLIDWARRAVANREILQKIEAAKNEE